jgi:lipopolysaccharide/colanic/teichoic acid biosynthesis glycosyltransferase
MSVTTEVSPLRVSEGARGARLERPIRALDIALALVMLLILVPVLLVAALAVRATSKGPAIFRQRRLGRDGRPFTVLKFRTMRTNADETRHREYIRHLITADEARRADDKQLYKTSVDELPQFWNVLRGEMSIVGPRPVIPYEAAIYPDWYRERFSVKPGITGLWQVSGRNGRTYEEMVALDIEFVRRRSLSLYLGIVLRTVPAIILRKGVA